MYTYLANNELTATDCYT